VAISHAIVLLDPQRNPWPESPTQLKCRIVSLTIINPDGLQAYAALSGQNGRPPCPDEADLPRIRCEMGACPKKNPNRGNVKTQFISTVLKEQGLHCFCPSWEMVTVMCMTANSTLTLAGLLQDPLIQMMMRSDKVSASDHAELLHRVKNSLIARASAVEPALEAAV
jgi:hypothetical protein